MKSEKVKIDKFKKKLVDFWQGKRDSNPQPAVLETVTLPLSHSPMHKNKYITVNKNSQENFKFFQFLFWFAVNLLYNIHTRGQNEHRNRH